MGATVTVGSPRRTVRQRRAELRRVLTASAAPALPLPTYDLLYGSEVERQFYAAAIAAGFTVYDGDMWPVESHGLVVDSTVVARDGCLGLHKLGDGVLALVRVHGGWCSVRIAAASEEPIGEVFSSFRSRYPAAYLAQAEDLRVPITFWTNSPHGPTPRLRRIESASWDSIQPNYTADVRAELDRLMAWEHGPDADGQLLIWLGPPGTGKSWALRALATQWAKWAEFHCIVDPDSFFVRDASYMASVLLADSYEAIDYDTGDIYSETDPEGKWRVLILEDTGELLAADAKDEYGQGLSRLLNVVDGMLGQGLRILALVTTNDEIDGLHPAAIRPGRCISQGADGVGPTTFGPLTAEEAQAWSGDPAAEAGTLAELYQRARTADAAAAFEAEVEERPAEFTPEPEDASDLMASALTAGAVVATSEKGKEIGAVAEEHAPEGGYGDTAWNADESTVFWVSADWTTTEEADAAEAAFLAIDGVDTVDGEAEAALPTGDGWEVVYRSGAASESALLDAVVTLAQRPLDLPEVAPPPPAVVPPEALVAAPAPPDPVFEAMTERARASDRLAHAAIDALAKFAGRPEAAAPPITTHMHLPAHALSVHYEAPDVKVEPHAHLTVEGTKVEPKFDVHMPEQGPVHVEVHPAEQTIHVAAADPAPVHVHLPESKARGVRLEYDGEGRKTFVPVDLEEEER